MNKMHLLPIIMFLGLHAMENSNNYFASIEDSAKLIILNLIGHPKFTAKKQQKLDYDNMPDEKRLVVEWRYQNDTIDYAEDVLIPLSITSKEINKVFNSNVNLIERKKAQSKFLKGQYFALLECIPTVSEDFQKGNLSIEKALQTEWIKRLDHTFDQASTMAVLALRWYGTSHTDLSKRFLKTCLPKLQEKQLFIYEINLNENKTVLDEVLKENGMYFQYNQKFIHAEQYDGVHAHCSPVLIEKEDDKYAYVTIKKQSPSNDWSICTVQ